MRFVVAAILALAASLPAQADPQPYGLPAVNTPLVGCVEGRALRIVNGAPSCASTAPPTVNACTGGAIDSTATDFIGSVSLPAGLSSCTVVMTKQYSTNFVCTVFAQTSGISITLAGPSVGTTTVNSVAYSSFTVPFGVTLAATKFGYICGPG